MSYEFVKKYNVLQACGGWSLDPSLSEDACNARLLAVKTWVDENFGDIFDTVIVDASSSTTTNTGIIYLYYKNTNFGIYLQNSTAAGSQKLGAFYGSNKFETVSVANLHEGEVMLFVAKSKYGVIAGFYDYDTDLSSTVKSIAINTGSGFIPIIIHSTSKCYIQTGKSSQVQFTLTQNSPQTQAVLQKFYPPLLDTTCEGIYWNVGQHLTSCVPYKIEGVDKMFLDLPGVSGYNTVTLELTEPTAADYAWAAVAE